MRGVDYGMNQAADAENDKAGPNKKDPAAFGLIAAYLYAAGPECPCSNQEAYYTNKNFLAVMIFKQEFFR